MAAISTTKDRLRIADELEKLFIWLGASDCCDVACEELNGAYPATLCMATGPNFYLGGAGDGFSLPDRFNVRNVWMDRDDCCVMTLRNNANWVADALYREKQNTMRRLIGHGEYAPAGDFELYYSVINARGEWAEQRRMPCLLSDDGTSVITTQKPVNTHGPKRRRRLSCPFPDESLRPPEDEEELRVERWLRRGAQILAGMAIFEPTYWRITVRLEEVAPALCLISDATGVKHILAARKVRPGRTRRDALLHWVREHWRQQRTDPEMEVFVRKHLRGSRDCSWAGMECHIDPSEQDQKKELEAKAEREAMRMREHNRGIRRRTEKLVKEYHRKRRNPSVTN